MDNNSFRNQISFLVSGLACAVEVCSEEAILEHIEELKKISKELDNLHYEAEAIFKEECASLFNKKGTLTAKTIYERLNYRKDLKELGERHGLIDKVALVADSQTSFDFDRAH